MGPKIIMFLLVGGARILAKVLDSGKLKFPMLFLYQTDGKTGEINWTLLRYDTFNKNDHTIEVFKNEHILCSYEPDDIIAKEYERAISNLLAKSSDIKVVSKLDNVSRPKFGDKTRH